MNLKFKAAGYTVGLMTLVFGSIAVLTYFAKENVFFILAGGLVLYLFYFLYSIKLSELEDEQRELQRVEDIVKAKNKLAELEQQ